MYKLNIKKLKKANGISWLLIPVLILTECLDSQQNKTDILIHTILTDKQSYFYLDTAKYPESKSQLPIGVFDSGTGGLTVFDALVNYDQYDNASHEFNVRGDGIQDFKSEYFVYLGDQANMPYGNYPQEKNLDLLKEHIIKDVVFLLGHKYYRNASDTTHQSDKKPVKAIVIACNTATAFGMEDIEVLLERAHLDLKVIGVIDAGVRAALAVMDKEASVNIGVMATAGTVASQGYKRTILSQWKEQDFQGSIAVFQQAGIGLAGAIDGSGEFISDSAEKPRESYKGPSETNKHALIDTFILSRYGFNWKDHAMLFKWEGNRRTNIQINAVENYIAYHLVSLLEQIRLSGQKNPLRVIILGCTHYPYYKEIFEKKLQDLYNYKENGIYIYRQLMASKIQLVDPAQNTARELYTYLNQARLYNTAQISQSQFYISVPNTDNKNVRLDSLGNFTYEYKYGRIAGEIQEYVKRIPLSENTISLETVNRLENKIPATLEIIRCFNQNR